MLIHSSDKKCDVRGCGNKAEYSFAVRGLNKKVNLCRECAGKLFDDLSKSFVTKSPRNKISSRLEEKEGVIRSGG